MNTRIWQEFLDSQNEDNPEGKQPIDFADLPYFTWIQEYFRTYSSWMEQQIHETSGVSEKVKEDASFWSKQMLSALSPKNYFWTNPEAINAFIESKGESLHKGLQNWLKDQQRDGMPEMVSSPALGQDTDRILSDVGYSPDEISSLRKNGSVN